MERDDWASYQKLVLSDISKLDDSMNEVKKTISSIMVEIGMLKVKAGIWGIVGGIVSGIGAAVVSLVHK